MLMIPVEYRAGKRCWFCGETRSVKYETADHIPVCNTCAARYGTMIKDKAMPNEAIRERASKMRLIRAFAKADSAFHASLKEDGYNVSYGLGNPVGGVYDAADPPYNKPQLAEVDQIWWRLQKKWRNP